MAPVTGDAQDRTRRAAWARERLPTGAVRQAQRWLELAMSRLGRPPGGADLEQEAADHLLRPLLLVDDWPGPTPPLRLPGPGPLEAESDVPPNAVHADLTDVDHASLLTLRSVLTEQTRFVDAELLASEAQQWRLAVTPYRSMTKPNPAFEPPTEPLRAADADNGVIDLAGARVVDLTALWAGPLATKLLADHGASVAKIDPSCRPDALREHVPFYHHLNGDKEIIDLDLRRADDRERFEALLSQADLLVDSFSRRVLPNLGYGQQELRRRFAGLSTLSIVAFPLGSPEQDWISYGPGVHAASGLADPSLGASCRESTAVFTPAPIAYPDALAGLEAFARASSILTQPGRGRIRAGHTEVSLAGAIAPLVTSARSAMGVPPPAPESRDLEHRRG